MSQVQAALDRLAFQFQDKANVRALLSQLVSPLDDLDVVVGQLQVLVVISSAVGAQLDLIGRIIGEPRQGFSDADYRTHLFARIRLNRSSGTPEDIFSLFKLAVPALTLKLDEYPPASLIFTVGPQPTLQPMISYLSGFLQAAKPAGVKAFLEYFNAGGGAQGAFLDASTLAMWRCDEGSAVNNLVDDTGNYTLTEHNSPPVITGQISGARATNTPTWPPTEYFDATSDAAFNAAMAGEWTFEGWIKPQVQLPVPALATLFCAGDGGAAYASTYAEISVDGANGNNLKLVWTIPFSTVTLNQSTGTRPPNGSWSHIAVRKKFNGATYDVAFFVNGVLQQTFVGNANTSTAGNVTITAGNTGSNFSHWFGGFDDLRLSKVARSDGEIMVSYLLGIGTRGNFKFDSSNPIEGFEVGTWASVV